MNKQERKDAAWKAYDETKTPSETQTTVRGTIIIGALICFTIIIIGFISLLHAKVYMDAECTGTGINYKADFNNAMNSTFNLNNSTIQCHINTQAPIGIIGSLG